MADNRDRVMQELAQVAVPGGRNLVEADLVRALKDGEIRGAGLDVFENEPALAPGLSELPNVVMAPHLGTATHETRLGMGRVAMANILAALRGETPPNKL